MPDGALVIVIEGTRGGGGGRDPAGPSMPARRLVPSPGRPSHAARRKQTLRGSFEDKPIVLDDTCYFVPCGSKAEAVCVHGLTSSVFRNAPNWCG